ncbi:hypothetical protein BRADI_3g33991v3, partial [Brachypodium distachyon]
RKRRNRRFPSFSNITANLPFPELRPPASTPPPPSLFSGQSHQPPLRRQIHAATQDGTSGEHPPVNIPPRSIPPAAALECPPWLQGSMGPSPAIFRRLPLPSSLVWGGSTRPPPRWPLRPRPRISSPPSSPRSPRSPPPAAAESPDPAAGEFP